MSWMEQQIKQGRKLLKETEERLWLEEGRAMERLGDGLMPMQGIITPQKQGEMSWVEGQEQIMLAQFMKDAERMDRIHSLNSALSYFMACPSAFEDMKHLPPFNAKEFENVDWSEVIGFEIKENSIVLHT